MGSLVLLISFADPRLPQKKATNDEEEPPAPVDVPRATAEWAAQFTARAEPPKGKRRRLVIKTDVIAPPEPGTRRGEISYDVLSKAFTELADVERRARFEEVPGSDFSLKLRGGHWTAEHVGMAYDYAHSTM